VRSKKVGRAAGRGEGGGEIRRGANGTLNGLGGSKHREGEEINDKSATDNPPHPLFPGFVGYSDFLVPAPRRE